MHGDIRPQRAPHHLPDIRMTRVCLPILPQRHPGWAVDDILERPRLSGRGAAGSTSSLPLTAQARVRIPAGSLAPEAGVAEEIPAAPASVVAGAADRTTGGPK